MTLIFGLSKSQNVFQLNSYRVIETTLQFYLQFYLILLIEVCTYMWPTWSIYLYNTDPCIMFILRSQKSQIELLKSPNYTSLINSSIFTKHIVDVRNHYHKMPFLSDKSWHIKKCNDTLLFPQEQKL